MKRKKILSLDSSTQIYIHSPFYRFVLYQLSKNLNRPFFMDFLTQLSIRYTEKSAVVDEEDPEDSGGWRFTWMTVCNQLFICLQIQLIGSQNCQFLPIPESKRAL